MSEEKLPKIRLRTFGHYRSYGPAHIVEIGAVDLYFSYETIVAFRAPGFGLEVCENIWSVTTGKHLNWIDGGAKNQRTERKEFLARLGEMCARFGFDHDEHEEW